MKWDIDLKFWEIKGTEIRLYGSKFVQLQNKKSFWKFFWEFENLLTIQTHFSAFYLISQNF